jgi:hypothetical protein
MKTIVIFAAIMALVMHVSAQTTEEIAQKINRPAPTPELVTARAQLERLCTDSAANWLTFYYFAYTDIELSFRVEDVNQKLQYIREAQHCLSKIKDGDRSEVETLRGYSCFALMAIDPAVNGPKYAAEIIVHYETALKANPSNPRAVLLNAIFRQNMAKSMGGAYNDLEADIARSRKLFASQDTTASKPCWGSIYLPK